MANPQKENGYTPIAHELIERLSRVKMSGSEWQYLMCIFRKTYGFHKKEDWVTNSQVVLFTGLPKNRVSEAKIRLLDRKIVTENRNKISIQKDWEKWIEYRKNGTLVPEKRYSEYRKSGHTIDTITKDNNYPAEPESSMYDIVPDLEEKPKKVPSRSKDIEAVFRLFNNPAWQTWKLRPIERKAAEVLFDTHGLEVLRKRLARIAAEKKKGDPYFPEVNTPSQLLDKMPNIERYLSV
jgi:phage replication O-like protein O